MSDAVTTELKSLGLTLGARKRLELELKAHRSRNDLRAHLKTIGLGLGARMRLENCLVDLLPAEGTEAAASAIAAPPESDDEGFVRSLAKEPSLRLLCLHGYASNNFVTRCQLASLGLESKHGVACDLLQASHPCERLDTSVDAVLEPDAKVFSWFDMPSLPDATAQQRETMHACLSRVMRVIEAHGPYDGIFGFSQGAVVASYLSSPSVYTGIFGKENCPWRFVICANAGGAKVLSSHGFVGGAAALPLARSCAREGRLRVPSLHLLGAKDHWHTASGRELQELYHDDLTESCTHPFGHELPSQLQRETEVAKTIATFIDARIADRGSPPLPSGSQTPLPGSPPPAAAPLPHSEARGSQDGPDAPTERMKPIVGWRPSGPKPSEPKASEPKASEPKPSEPKPKPAGKPAPSVPKPSMADARKAEAEAEATAEATAGSKAEATAEAAPPTAASAGPAATAAPAEAAATAVTAATAGSAAVPASDDVPASTLSADPKPFKLNANAPAFQPGASPPLSSTSPPTPAPTSDGPTERGDAPTVPSAPSKSWKKKHRRAKKYAAKLAVAAELGAAQATLGVPPSCVVGAH